jgi:hypothetical protein
MQLVAPSFYYLEKGDENDAALSCSDSTTLFFTTIIRKVLLHQAKSEISRNEQNISRNTI